MFHGVQGAVLTSSLKAAYGYAASSLSGLAVFGDLLFANVLFALTVAISLLSLIKMAPKN